MSIARENTHQKVLNEQHSKTLKLHYAFAMFLLFISIVLGAAGLAIEEFMLSAIGGATFLISIVYAVIVRITMWWQNG
jgi:1,4-dihydroxy-2-naphthoate octaprenyltransferase